MLALGVDGGGSKTFAVLADETGSVLGFGRGGCGNYQINELPGAMIEIERACRGALDAAGAKQADVGCFCLSGADFSDDFDVLVPAVCALQAAADSRVYNDTAAAFHAGSRRGFGAVVIMGSGMNAAGFAPDGRDCRLPGEGYLYGDWGGAHQVGADVLHYVFRGHDGRGRPTVLQDMVLQRLGITDMDALTRKLYEEGIPGAQIAGLITLLAPAAEGGDAVATAILDRIAEETAASTRAMLGRLDMLESPCDVVVGGGVYRCGGKTLLRMVERKIAEVAPQAQVILPEVEPVMGAVVLALRLAGFEITDALLDGIRSGNERFVAGEAAKPRA